MGSSATTVGQLEQALPSLLPEGICERHAWLFARWLELEGFRDDFRRMEEEVARLRAAALREILDKDGFAGVLRFADIVESPAQVGVTLAQTDCVPQELDRARLSKARIPSTSCSQGHL